MRAAILLLSLLVSSIAHAAVYKWVDKDGKTHFSDKPIESAEVVTFKSNTTNQITVQPPYALNLEQSSDDDQQTVPDYKLTITSPSEEQTLRDDNGDLTIIGAIEPELKPDHVVILSINGEISGQAQSSAIFYLKNVDRGEHKLVMRVLDKSGKQLAISPTRTIFLHRTSVLHRPRPFTPKR